MLKLIAVAAFALAVTSSAEAMTPAPVHQPQGMITHVAFGCGVGRTRINGVCVSRANPPCAQVPTMGWRLLPSLGLVAPRCSD